MSSSGKYVRAPPAAPESDVEGSSCDESEVGRFVRAPSQDSSAEEGIAEECGQSSRSSPGYQMQLEARVLELENVIKKMSGATDDATRMTREESYSEVGPSITPSAPPPTSPTTSPSPTGGSAIRWDNIRPFPKNVAASKMWEAWVRFLEDFEAAAFLSNLKDPKRRVELLLLSMGDELKSIVRAAKLRPGAEEGDNLYNKFVGNIDKHLKAMTDPAAEHEDFSKMVQEEGEPAVKFHARLTEKVLLCDYSPTDQDRFVRTQLLRGLRNQELKKTARMYGHDSNTIVQAATRAEAFQAEMAALGGESNALVVSSGRVRSNEGQFKRRQAVQQTNSKPLKRFKSERSSSFQPGSSVSRRNRCPRCFRPAHRGEECPALRKICNACGQRGHFAAACRVDRVSTVKDEWSGAPVDDNRSEQVKE